MSERNEMPERIWAYRYDFGINQESCRCFEDESFGECYVEYVRSDLKSNLETKVDWILDALGAWKHVPIKDTK